MILKRVIALQEVLSVPECGALWPTEGHGGYSMVPTHEALILQVRITRKGRCFLQLPVW